MTTTHSLARPIALFELPGGRFDNITSAPLQPSAISSGAQYSEIEMASEHTPGPWAWFGNATTNSLYLATTHSGRRFVMDFTRWGFRGAQPRFQAERGIMIDAKDLLQFEVGDQSVVGVEAAKKDTSVYRLDVRSIKSADARLIAAAPDLLDACNAILGLLQLVCGRDDVPAHIRELLLHNHRVDEVNSAISKAEGR